LENTGFGKSQCVNEENISYTLDDYVDDIISFLDSFQIKNCILVGHDMGALIAQLCSIRQPLRVHKLVLISATYD